MTHDHLLFELTFRARFLLSAMQRCIIRYDTIYLGLVVRDHHVTTYLLRKRTSTEFAFAGCRRVEEPVLRRDNSGDNNKNAP